MSETLSLGYVMNPSKYAPPLGSQQVEIWLSSSPTDRFFDIQTLRIQPLDCTNRDHFTIGPNEVLTPDRLIPPGRIVMLAHDGDVAELFGFGCTFNAQQEEPYLHCTLTSSAPFLDVPADEQAVGRILVDELNALAARVCAEANQSGTDDGSQPTAPPDPYPLFLAALVALTEEHSLTPPVPDSQYTAAQEALNSVIADVRAKDGWPATIASFASLCKAWENDAGAGLLP